jgi:hypothetical protein
LGCSYALKISVPPTPSSGALSEEDVERVKEEVSRVAREFGLEEVRNKSHLQYLRRTSEEQQYPARVLAWFVGESAPATDRSRIFLSVAVEKESDSLRLLLRDWDSTGPTHFTASLRDTLMRVLRDAFPERQVTVERVYDMPLHVLP